MSFAPKQAAAKSVRQVESLEARRHLSATQVGDIVEMEWQGRIIEARAGEWIVSLESTPPSRNADGEMEFHDAPTSRATTPNNVISRALDAAQAFGIEFDRYLGDESVFLIRTSANIAASLVTAMLSRVPGFVSVDPNAVVRAFTPSDTPASGPSGLHDVGQSPSNRTSDADGDADSDGDEIGELAGGSPETHRHPGTTQVGDIVEMEWQGRTVEVRAGEWLVSLKEPEPTRDDEGEIVDYNYNFKWGSTPTETLAAAMDALQETGITFDKYLGREHVFSVHSPVSATYEEMLVALSSLEGFQVVEPNGVVRAALLISSPNASAIQRPAAAERPTESTLAAPDKEDKEANQIALKNAEKAAAAVSPPADSTVRPFAVDRPIRDMLEPVVDPFDGHGRFRSIRESILSDRI